MWDNLQNDLRVLFFRPVFTTAWASDLFLTVRPWKYNDAIQYSKNTTLTPVQKPLKSCFVQKSNNKCQHSAATCLWLFAWQWITERQPPNLLHHLVLKGNRHQSWRGLGLQKKTIPCSCGKKYSQLNLECSIKNVGKEIDMFGNPLMRPVAREARSLRPRALSYKPVFYFNRKNAPLLGFYRFYPTFRVYRFDTTFINAHLVLCPR